MNAKGQTGQGSPKTIRPKSLPRTDNLLESLRDIGNAGFQSMKKDLLEGIPHDIFTQLFGTEKSQRRAQGELKLGESLEIDTMLQEEREENKILRLRLAREQQIRQEDEKLIEQKTQNLKLELSALTRETQNLAQATKELTQETKIAALQVPANPGIYHLNFFEKLRAFISSFRKKIENASLWLRSYNQRAAKKHTFWGQVAKVGSKRLLSPEDYLQRAAG
jgi:hypothetical protein